MNSPRHPKPPLIEIAPGLEFPEVVRHTADLGGYTVEVDVVPNDGRLVAARVVIEQSKGGESVDAAVLRTIPLAQLIRDAARDHLVHVDAKAVALGADPDDVRRRGPGDDFALQAVAVVFARAHAVGNEPTKAVIDTFGLTRATAGRWIKRARERGFLSAAEQGRRGRHGQR